MMRQTPEASAASYVLAVTTAPDVALEVHRRLQDVIDRPNLRAPEDQWWLYEKSQGFQLRAYDRRDKIERQIALGQEAHQEQLEATAQGETAFIDPVSIILVSIATPLILGVTKRATDDLSDAIYGRLKGIARRASRMWTSGAPESRGGTDLADVFETLGLLYLDERVQGVPMFVRVLDPELTFLSEPNLPREAVQEAARLCLIKERPTYFEAHRPLRWMGSRFGGWTPMPPWWASADYLRRLRRELAGQAS